MGPNGDICVLEFYAGRSAYFYGRPAIGPSILLGSAEIRQIAS